MDSFMPIAELKYLFIYPSEGKGGVSMVLMLDVNSEHVAHT